MRWIPMAALLCLAAVQAAEPKTDHPLVSPYEGSKLRKKQVIECDRYDAFMGMDASGKEPTGLALEGKITKILYDRPKDRSILEVFRNYEQAMAQAGVEILFRCDQEQRECAKSYAAVVMNKYSGLSAVSNTGGRYLLGRLDNGEATAYIAIGVGVNFTDVHVIEVQAMESDKVVLDASALGKGLDTRGYVVVNGIFFDTDEATLKAESQPALTEVAKLLADRADLNVYVVGHTDMQGSFEHNRGLSQRRATAVVQELANNHGVARERMEPFGVGPLAPQASNASDAGRARNRRVVLVAR